MTVNNSVFLCGYFSVPNLNTGFAPSGWQAQEYTEAQIRELDNYYLPEFTAFMATSVRKYILPIQKNISFAITDTITIPLLLNNIKMYIAPFGMILYAIGIEAENIEYNILARALNSLRNCGYYGKQHEEFVELAIKPVLDIYCSLLNKTTDTGDSDFSFLIESGNKFKLFQAISSEQIRSMLDDDEESSRFIYAAGTLSPYEKGNLGITAETYYKQIIAEHLVSVFKGWKALTLLDTFTMLSIDTPDWVINNWKTDYFDMIYIYQLFRKVFLYNVNTRYRHRTTDVELLEQQLKAFEQQYSFNSVSYNFLPNLINEALEKSQSTAEDSNQLYKMISREMDARKEAADEKTNKFLTFLTVVTIFSAIYDITCLLDESFHYDHFFQQSMFGYRLVSIALLLLIVIVYLIVLLIYKKHKK